MSSGRLRSTDRRLGLAIAGVVIALVAGACSGAGGGGGGAGTTTITLAAVDNPSMADLKQLIPDFQSAHPTIQVKVVTLPPKADVDRDETEPVVDSKSEAVPKLRRDPQTGIYRP